MNRARLAEAPASTLGVRLASAFAMGPVALAAVWFGAPWFAFLVALAAAGMAWEWARLSGGDRSAVKAAAIATALGAVLAASLGATLAGLAIAVLGAAAVWACAQVTQATAPVWTAGGALWVALPCVVLLWLASGAGRETVFWLLFVVWATDTGAYAFGRALGGPRLAPLLSPNKTWAGSLGGLFCAGLIGVAAALLTHAPLVAVTAASLLLSAAGQLGDLAESMAKRRFGAKDSGALIPGHGGLLDRLDSLLTATATLGLVILLGGGSPLAGYP